jgi:hypothetical protein
MKVKPAYQKPAVTFVDDRFCCRMLKKDSWIGRNISHIFTGAGAFAGLTAGITYTLAMSYFIVRLIDTSIDDETEKKALTDLFSSMAPGSFTLTLILSTGGGAYAGRQISRLLLR